MSEINRDNYYVYGHKGGNVYVDDGFDYYGNEIKDEDEDDE